MLRQSEGADLEQLLAESEQFYAQAHFRYRSFLDTVDTEPPPVDVAALEQVRRWQRCWGNVACYFVHHIGAAVMVLLHLLLPPWTSQPELCCVAWQSDHEERRSGVLCLGQLLSRGTSYCLLIFHVQSAGLGFVQQLAALMKVLTLTCVHFCGVGVGSSSGAPCAGAGAAAASRAAGH